MPVAFERVPAYYHKYIQLVSETSLRDALQQHIQDLSSFLQTIPEDKWNSRYAEGKWSIKELVQHVTDTERIFTYRALCIARKDNTPLPGFDEKQYAANAKAERRTKADLIAELQAVQQATQKLFESFDEEQLQASGMANGNPVYVEGIGYIIVGHTLHHKKILQERYL